jgi:hypothetical protein
MKVNHEQTRGKIIEITELLKAQAVTAQNFKENSNKVLADESLSQKYQNDRIAELRENYIVKHKETKEKVIAILEEISPLELENEKILEYDIPEFANTMSAINSTQGKLPADVMESIKLNFAGHYQVLLSIKAAFEHYGIDLTPYKYEVYVTSAAFVINDMMKMAENLELSESSSFIALRQLHAKVIRFGEVRGIKFSPDEKTFGSISEDVSDALARQVMGLE